MNNYNMSDDNMANIINNGKNMVDSGNIPDDIKKMISNLNNSSTSNQSKASNNSTFNVDMDTMLKMKSMIEAMNQKDDPRANLLHSLKPYLRDSKKDKLDQYVNLLNMTKIADIMKDQNKGNNNV